MSSFETTVTIKYGKGYDESWAVFKGSNAAVREAITDYFSMDASDLTLHELVLNATKVAQGGTVAVRALGATAIPSTTPVTPNNDQPDEAQAGGDAWAQAESSTPAAPVMSEEDRVLALIEAQQSVNDVRQLYTVEPTIASTPTLLAAWKARGKALAPSPA